MLPSIAQAEPVDAVSAARWSSLVAAIQRLSAAHDLDEIVEIVRVSAREISGADGVTFVLRDEDRCHYVAESAISPLWTGQKFPMSACISGWCMLNGATAVIPDIYADARVPADAYRLTFVKSLVMTPVRVENPIAAIGAYWARYEEPAAETVSLLETLARSTATAIANVQLVASLTASEQTARRQLEIQRLLLEELNHRVKNTLATVQAIAKQTLRRMRDPAAFVAGFEGRLQALSRSHELFTRTTWTGADLAELIQEQLAIGQENAEQIRLCGPKAMLEPQMAQHVGLVLHELATNARKHGALSAPGGRVDISWSLSERPELALRWAEGGGPPVRPPEKTGFGMIMIERGLRHIGAEAKVSFGREGVCCDMLLPLRKAAESPLH
ncbi:two-component sensor histidine kinase [Rhodoblastus acidophilus]|uniref:sensor histidine kinase n=1 Tax=Rhodoblastus acidophilus TaxID=1074 RepID=UPI00222527A7|nr:HWE histidine kinase domain-containing protein [Rhodoblastus acidophilus]MCW2283519.1 two-component sensor histidine kinase [Rhodoblastus acidophilus]MCW2332379.1 two-component sensor histidine kinase [Rhodoblastus acidophilus]